MTQTATPAAIIAKLDGPMRAFARGNRWKQDGKFATISECGVTVACNSGGTADELNESFAAILPASIVRVEKMVARMNRENRGRFQERRDMNRVDMGWSN